MSAPHTVHVKRRMLVWSVLPICLFLVFLGMRVPTSGSLHRVKPRACAIIESSQKSSQEAGVKSVALLAVCQQQPALVPPQPLRGRFLRETCRLVSTPPVASCARAPPSPFAG